MLYRRKSRYPAPWRGLIDVLVVCFFLFMALVLGILMLKTIGG